MIADLLLEHVTSQGKYRRGDEPVEAIGFHQIIISPSAYIKKNKYK